MRSFKIFSIWPQTDKTGIHTHAHAQCSHASVGLAQARPNYPPALTIYYTHILHTAQLVLNTFVTCQWVSNYDHFPREWETYWTWSSGIRWEVTHITQLTIDIYTLQKQYRVHTDGKTRRNAVERGRQYQLLSQLSTLTFSTQLIP